MALSLQDEEPRRSGRDRRPVERLVVVNMVPETPEGGKRRVSIDSGESWYDNGATPNTTTIKRRRLEKDTTPRITRFKGSYVTPSSTDQPNQLKPVLDPTKPGEKHYPNQRKEHGLATLARKFRDAVAVSTISLLHCLFSDELCSRQFSVGCFVMQESGNRDIDLDETVLELGISKRRIYDVTNILEGAGLLKRSEERKNEYRWVASAFKHGPQDNNYTAADIPKQLASLEKLKQEERQLDDWIKRLTKQVSMENSAHNMYSSELKPFLKDNSTMLIIAAPRKSVLHVPHVLNTPPPDGHYKFSLDSPTVHDTSNSMLPRAFLLESREEPMRQLSLVPPPPLLEQCCSDFTADALLQGLPAISSSSSAASRQRHVYEESMPESIEEAIETTLSKKTERDTANPPPSRRTPTLFDEPPSGAFRPFAATQDAEYAAENRHQLLELLRENANKPLAEAAQLLAAQVSDATPPVLQDCTSLGSLIAAAHNYDKPDLASEENVWGPETFAAIPEPLALQESNSLGSLIAAANWLSA